MRQHGFTVVEALVALVLMAVLVCLLLPAVSRAQSGSAEATCMSILQQIAMANSMYADASNEWYVPIKDHTRPFTAGGVQHDGIHWPQNPLFCDLMGYEAAGLHEAWHWPEQFICPKATLALAERDAANHCRMEHSYGVNATGLFDVEVWFNDNPTQINGYQRSRVVNPAQAVFYGDSLNWLMVDTDWDRYVDETLVDGRAAWSTAYRHTDGAANMVFFDGHGESLAQAQLDEDLTGVDNRWLIQGYEEGDAYVQ